MHRGRTLVDGHNHTQHNHRTINFTLELFIVFYLNHGTELKLMFKKTDIKSNTRNAQLALSVLHSKVFLIKFALYTSTPSIMCRKLEPLSFSY